MSKRSSSDLSTSTSTNDNNNNNNNGRGKPTNRIRLLLHAVDGCVPYLTPDVLERHFPPPIQTKTTNDNDNNNNDNEDILWIGMEVRNTSVVPYFDDHNENSKHYKNKQKKEKQQQQQQRDSKNTNTNTNHDTKKPRGYAFEAVPPDPWLLPYTRVTVPSFDLLHDDDSHNKHKQHQKSMSENNNNSNSNNTFVSNKQVSVWTPHGRQKLSSGQYAKSAMGLNSQFTLSLYDMNDEDGNTIKRYEKAKSRNKQWFQDLLVHSQRKQQQDEQQTNESSSSSSSSSALKLSGSLWSPILLPTTTIATTEDQESTSTTTTPTTTTTTTLVSTITAHEKWEDVTGIALIGRWMTTSTSSSSLATATNGILEKDHDHDQQQSKQRAQFLESIVQSLSSSNDNNNDNNNNISTIKYIAVLYAHSFLEVLDIVSTGIVNVIGTDLPTRWAKDKLAFGIDINNGSSSSITTTETTTLESNNDDHEQKNKRAKTQKHDPDTTTTTSNTTTSSTDEKEEAMDDDNNNNNNTILNIDGCMDMDDIRFAKDTRPLLPGCQCLACNKNEFSRAYIHHLVRAKELLAEILLFGHNLHHFLLFLQTWNNKQYASATVATTEEKELFLTSISKQLLKK